MVLPALVVLGLVAVVAIASTGSTPGGSSETRPPSESLLDTFFTLGLVGVVVGGVLLLYGLTQRKAIAREVAKGRIPRFGLLSTLALLGFFTAVTYWRFRNWEPPAPAEEEGDFAFPGPTPVPTTPEQEQLAPYEPSVCVASDRRRRRTRRRRDRRVRRLGTPRARAAGARARHLAEQLADVLDETLDDLRAEADPRRAIIAAYARLERVLAANGVRTPHVGDLGRVPPARPPRPRARLASGRTPDGALHAG